MSSCSTVKSADDESYKANSFVRLCANLKTDIEIGSEWLDFLHVCRRQLREGVMDWSFGARDGQDISSDR